MNGENRLVGGVSSGAQNDAGHEQVPSACEPPFMLSVLGGKADDETEREKKRSSVCSKGELSIFPQFCKVYHVPIYKSKETVRLMKYDSQLISVEHRRSIPHQR